MDIISKNTFWLRQNGIDTFSHNMILTNWRISLGEGKTVTQCIAIGRGTGTPLASRTTLFDFITARDSQIIDIICDKSIGNYMIARKIVLEADEFVGETITEIGFSPFSSNNIVTHCVLENGITKTNARLEIIGYFYLPHSSNLLEGDNPIVRCFLGERAFDKTLMKYGYCKYNSIADANGIAETYQCQYLESQNPLSFYCGMTDGTKPDAVLFYDNVPVMKADGRVVILNPAVLDGTVNDIGTVPLINFVSKKVSSFKTDGAYVTTFAMNAEILGTNNPLTEFSKLKNGKIKVSNDKQFLIIYERDTFEVYRNFLDKLIFIDRVRLNNVISHLDVCLGRLVIVCNRKDTPLSGTNARRLYKYEIYNDRLTRKDFANDLDFDIDAMSLSVCGSGQMIFYYIQNGTLTGMTFNYTAVNAALILNNACETVQADFIGSSYRRDVVFAARLNTEQTNGSVYLRLLNGESKSIYGQILTSLKEIVPDNIYLNGEAIVSYNSTQKTAVIYSFVTSSMMTYDFSLLFEGLAEVFSDGEMFLIVKENEFLLYQLDYHDLSLIQKAAGALTENNFDGAAFLAGMLIMKKGDALHAFGYQFENMLLRCDANLYNSVTAVRYQDFVPLNQSDYNSILVSIMLAV